MGRSPPWRLETALASSIVEPGKRQRLRLGAACDEQLSFLRDYGFAWEPWTLSPVMMGESWEASSPFASVMVCVDRRDGGFTVFIGPAGHRGLDLDLVADRLNVPKEQRPRLEPRG